MSTLGGLFETKPRCKRNFLLENIRGVSKERIKNSQSGNLQTVKHGQSSYKNLQPLLKSVHQNIQLKGPSIKSASPQTIQVSKRKNTVLANLHRQKNCGTKYHTDNGSQTTCDLHSLYRKKDDDNVKNFLRRDASPVCKYIDEENVPFRWTQVCPSVISHMLCHQSVQTLSEDDLDSLLEDGSIKYPTTNKIAGNVKDKDIPNLEWPAYADDENSIPFESVASHSKSTDLSSSPVEYNTVSSTQQNKNSMLGEKKSLSEASGKLSLRSRHDDRASSPPRSRHQFPSKTNGEGMNGKYKLQDIGNESFGDLRIDETDTVKRQSRVKEQFVKPHIQLKSNGDKQIENIEFSSVSSNGVTSRPPTSYQKGVIPKYLAKRINEQKVLAKTPVNNEIEVLEDERRAALKKATKDFETLIAELNKMPVRTDTLRTKTRKIEIENELNVLERRIRALTRISDL